MFDGYVLVGGKSSRMGTNKFALRFGNATFSERAVAALQKIVAGRVSFIVGEDQKEEITRLLPLDVPRITDVFPHKAALGGIFTALTYSKSEWAAILACDYPFVTEDLFNRLAEIADSVDEKIAAVAPVQPDGRVQPLCTLYRVKPCLTAVVRLLNNDKIPPVRRLLENVETRRVEFRELMDLLGAKNFFANVNTPEDYLRVLNIYQKTQHNS
ncbi:MAG: molybdenum cofactor guanylyltransferase [Pyrinomonadaceae bacterium]